MHDFSSLQLDTPRLLLRPLQSTDAPALFALFSDPEVMRYWSSGPWTERAQADAMIASDQRQLAEGKAIRLGLIRRSDGAVIGTCSLFNLVQDSRRAEIGYALAPHAWHQGHVQEAVGALIDWAFGPALNLNRLEADIDPRNIASGRSLLRLGFQCEGLLRERWFVASEVSDTAMYGLLQREWPAARMAS
ncbi:MAG TPA: GNAT family N-acetyltransferase [Ideonella sp.]|uniref:GNAT family N-acetyltransferase n=1 Tax=Ideonella sp. TaxID=1929293 RepID=UPI002C594634|nr:GNAT family N-acetyltransferase [Ideonella sp.]HSI48687.1 GNAT family N-acetyltransferase [Ideonella sp.]